MHVSSFFFSSGFNETDDIYSQVVSKGVIRGESMQQIGCRLYVLHSPYAWKKENAKVNNVFTDFRKACDSGGENCTAF